MEGGKWTEKSSGQGFERARVKCEWVGRGMWVRGGGLPSLSTFPPWNSSIETGSVLFFIHLFESLILFFFLPQRPQVLPNLRKSTGSLQ